MASTPQRSQRGTKTRIALPAKLVMPRPKTALARPRLFRRLRGRAAAPVVWVQAPAGSGKTFLLASCLRARAARTLWYDIDASDRDVSGVFHFLQLAAEGQLGLRLDLPAFPARPTTDYSSFARRYFTSLFEQLPRGSWLAFDNYHEAQDAAEWNVIFRELLAVRRHDVRINVASRRGPPASFARFRAAGELGIVPFDELRFDEREVQQWMRKQQIAVTDCDRLVHSTRGWAVAISLLARVPEKGSPPKVTAARSAAAMVSVFEYLAAELFERLQPDERTLLPMLALLPRFSAEMATRLTDRDDAPAILRRLERDHLLLEDHGDGRYKLHDLLRAFLLERFRSQHASERRHELCVRAARLLEDGADFEVAAELLSTAGAASELCSLIERSAPELAAQGRLTTLAHAISLVPEQTRSERPWIEVWLALAQLGRSESACGLAEHAFTALQASGDKAGAALAWAVVVQALILDGNDFRALVRWLRMRDQLGEISAPPQIATRVAIGEVIGWAYAGADFGSDVQARARRALAQVQRLGGTDERLLATVTAAMIFVFAGQRQRGHELLRAGQLLVASSKDPLSRLIALHAELLIARVFGGRFRGAESLVDEALVIARTENISVLDLDILLLGAMCALALGDLKTAARLIAGMRTYPHTTRMARGESDYVQAWYALDLGDLIECERLLVLSAREVELLGFQFALFEIGTARLILAARTQDRQTIRSALTNIDDVASPSPLQASTRALAVVYCNLCLGEAPTAALQTALQTAREVGWRGGGFISATIVRTLCNAAFAHEIELEFASELLATYELSIGDEGVLLPSWPWHVRARLLGGLEITVAENSVAFGRKLPTVPIALLKLLAAADGPIAVTKLTRALWPGQDARAARAALDTALYRLRKLLGSEAAIEHTAHGTLSLARAHCWSDVRAMHLVCERITALTSEGKPHARDSIPRLERLLAEYDQGTLASENDPLALRHASSRLENKICEARNALAGWRSRHSC